MSMRKTAQDRKAEISRVVLDLAFEVGPDQVTTGMIANRMGLTQPAVYKHFPRKEDIWLTVTDNLSTRVAKNIAHAETEKLTPDARLRLLVMEHLQLVRDNPALPEIMVMRAKTDAHGALRSQMLTTMADFRKVLARNVAAAVAQGIFRRDLNPNDASTLILGIIQSLVLRMLLTRDPEVLMQDGERLLNLLLSGFAQLEGNA
uniref:TetR/AcrR family transcriptional regulator n=1 Tax=Pararhizobium sp. IMCC3301 TaxID=3067904 RepID=UPI0027417F2C|nr:TetR/AcrR family transcriptional regulator [Pararhizobium sp. IMCC3301]